MTTHLETSGTPPPSSGAETSTSTQPKSDLVGFARREAQISFGTATDDTEKLAAARHPLELPKAAQHDRTEVLGVAATLLAAGHGRGMTPQAAVETAQALIQAVDARTPGLRRK